jgi:4'-phosphopantetheinyl transferase
LNEDRVIFERSPNSADGCLSPPFDGVDFWYVHADAMTPNEALERFEHCLSTDEKDTHDRFVFESDRHSYLLSHVLVRLALSHYLSLPPKCWTFRRGLHGKPSLSGPTEIPMKFNLSHTTGVAVCGVTVGREVGVDVEALPARANMREVAARFFSKPEVELVQKLTPEESDQRSLELWTLKESFVKALGLGLSLEPNLFGFAFDSGGTPRLEFTTGVGEPLQDWRFARLTLRSSYTAAIALQDARSLNLVLHAIELVPPNLSPRIRPLTPNSHNYWTL